MSLDHFPVPLLKQLYLTAPKTSHHYFPENIQFLLGNASYLKASSIKLEVFGIRFILSISPKLKLQIDEPQAFAVSLFRIFVRLKA